MGKCKLIVAAAGSGKTTFLVREALKIRDEKILITTFTQANEEEIRNKFFEENRYIPENIDIQTWFSFLLQHGVRPYQNYLYDKDITGLLLVNGRSAQYIKETDTQNHYFSNEGRIYSDKLAKFAVRCNDEGRGCVIKRIQRIYAHILIDEVQDLAGFDLDILKLFFQCNSNILMVGDPRQGTYSTNDAAKNRKFRRDKIVNFFEEVWSNLVEIDDTLLTTNYRCVPEICNFSDRLFPNFKCSASGNSEISGHDGIFLVRSEDVDVYLKKYYPVQLRHSKKMIVNPNFKVLNFGDSKGLSFNRVLVYPTKPICDWLRDNNSKLEPTSRSRFYVAATRARFSVGIMYDFDEATNINGVKKYFPA